MAKIKMKTKSAAKRRFKLTAKGKVKRAKAYRRHLLIRQTRKTKRQLRAGGYVHKSNEKTIKTLLQA